MIARIRRFAVSALTLTLLTLAAPPAHAQQSSAAATPAAPPASELAAPQAAPPGPTIERAAVAARTQDQQPAPDSDAALQQRLGLGKARALMIVGFATVIIGLMIGDDPGTLIAIAGAAVGLYGLYNYLK